MVFDILRNASVYASLHPRFARAFEYLQNTDLLDTPNGKYELDGESMFAIVQEYLTKEPGAGKWETHRRYIDIQLLLSGTEKICCAPLARMTPGDYVAEKDFWGMSGAGDFITMHPGDFTIFFPEDAHMPSMAVDTPVNVKKVVVKVAVAG